MVVLSKSKDDKGTQLEHLTRDLLARKGYSNIVVSYISSGGAEIDVKAEYVIPGIGKPQTQRLICECKAHEKPMDITQWNKFLGKIFVEELRSGQQVAGCFVALDGVNGYVAGNYDDVKERRPDITIIDGDQLIQELADIYGLCSRADASETVRRLTSRTVRATEVAYYDKQAYWLVLFEGDKYTLLSSSGEPIINTATLDMIKPMIERVQAVSQYIDLPAEAEAKLHAVTAQVALIAQLMLDDGATTLTRTQNETSSILAFSHQDLEQAALQLREMGLAKLDADNENFSFIEFDAPPEAAANQYAELYKFLLMPKPEGKIPYQLFFRAIGCPFYDSHIDKNLVGLIQETQGNLPLSEDDIQEIIKVCTISPSSLINALLPFYLVEKHRREAIEKGEDSSVNQDIWDRNMFMNFLYTRILADFPRVELREYFFHRRQIREIEREQKLYVKSKSKVEVEGKLHERQGIGELVEGFNAPDGGSLIYVTLSNEAPEPWNWPTPEESSEAEATKSNGASQDTNEVESE